MFYQWHITDNCDQRCKHCYIWNENYERCDMSREQIDYVLNQVTAFDNNVGFAITGGDPILNKHFWYLLERLNNKNIYYVIFGNPFHLSTDICQRLKELGCQSYQLSLDGMRDTHDSIRIKGSFDSTIKAIEMLKQAGMKVKIMSTVSSVNIDEIPALFELCYKLNVDSFSFARYCAVGKDISNGITPQRYRKLLGDIDRRNERYIQNGWSGLWKKDHLWLLYEVEKAGAASVECNGICGCGCGIRHLTICPNGDLMACRRVIDSVVGNIFTDNLANVWLNKVNRYRQYDKFEKCSKCFLHMACRGCPATANSFYEPDPQCWKEL